MVLGDVDEKIEEIISSLGEEGKSIKLTNKKTGDSKTVGEFLKMTLSYIANYVERSSERAGDKSTRLYRENVSVAITDDFLKSVGIVTKEDIIKYVTRDLVSELVTKLVDKKMIEISAPKRMFSGHTEVTATIEVVAPVV